MLMAELGVENVVHKCGHIMDRILKTPINLTTPDPPPINQMPVVVLRLGLVSISVLAVARRGNPNILKAGYHAIGAMKTRGHTINHLPCTSILTMNLQHATSVHIVATSGNRLVLIGASHAGIADATYGHTKDGKYLQCMYLKDILP